MWECALDIHSREDFRRWLEANSDSARECWLTLRRGRPKADGGFWYLDAVEEALCFGWIDSTQKKVDGVVYQRFSPRRKNGLWTELNKARVRRLESLGLMTDAGRAVLPPKEEDFVPDPAVEADLRRLGVWEAVASLPPLYRRIRLYNLWFYRTHVPLSYDKSLARFADMTRQGKLYGEWDDYGRLPHD